MKTIQATAVVDETHKLIVRVPHKILPGAHQVVVGIGDQTPIPPSKDLSTIGRSWILDLGRRI